MSAKVDSAWKAAELPSSRYSQSDSESAALFLAKSTLLAAEDERSYSGTGFAWLKLARKSHDDVPKGLT